MILLKTTTEIGKRFALILFVFGVFGTSPVLAEKGGMAGVRVDEGMADHFFDSLRREDGALDIERLAAAIANPERREGYPVVAYNRVIIRRTVNFLAENQVGTDDATLLKSSIVPFLFSHKNADRIDIGTALTLGQLIWQLDYYALDVRDQVEYLKTGLTMHPVREYAIPLLVRNGSDQAVTVLTDRVEDFPRGHGHRRRLEEAIETIRSQRSNQ